MLKVVVAGAGDFSQFHLAAWNKQTEAKVVAIQNRTVSKAEKRAEEFGVPTVYGDLEEAFDKEQPDIVDIVAGPSVHVAIGTAAAKRGIHVICQKPIAYTEREAKELIAVCRQYGVKLMINEDHRFMGWIIDHQKLVGEGAVGRPHYFRLAMRTGGLFPVKGKDKVDWDNLPFYMREETGVLHEWGIHHIESIRFIMGKEMESVFATMRTVVPEGRSLPADTISSIIIHFTDGTYGVYEVSSSNYQPELWLRIDGNEGTITSDLKTLWLYRGDTDEKKAVKEIEQYETNNARRILCQGRMQQHVIDCILNEKEPLMSGEDNIKSLAAMHACYRSNKEGRVVTLEEMLSE